MSTGIIITGVLLLMLTLLLVRVPVALALAISGAVGLLGLHNFGYATNVLGSEPFSVTSAYGLTIVPMFILMGMFAVRAHVAEYVFKIANRVLGKFPGGLGIATVAASAGFSAVSGSSIGTAATMARLSVAEMRQAGYPASLATALVAVAGTLGSMIPPSTFLVLYAILAQVSIAQMLAAGIVPGVISALAYASYLFFAGWRRQQKGILQSNTVSEAVVEAGANLSKERVNRAKRNQKTHKAEARATAVGTTTKVANERSDTDVVDKIPLSQLPWRGLTYIGMLFTIVLGGMYSGLFTATESAAFGALAAVAILLIELRKTNAREIWKGIRGALQDTASTTSMVFFIVIGSGILTAFLVAARVPQLITETVLSWNLPPMVVIGLLLLALIPLGMVLESLSIEAPWVLFRFLYGAQGLSLGHMIAGFYFGRGLVVQGLMHAVRVPPVDPVHRFEFDLGG